VPNVTGTVSLRVPAGTQSGQVFNVRGRGLPRVNASGTGDLRVRVQMWTPDSVSGEEEQLIKRLGELQAGRTPGARSRGIWGSIKEALGA
jgi:molecular chaperone DnaJ